MPIRTAMVKAGYSKSTAERSKPGQGFLDLLQEAIPDAYLAKRLRHWIDSDRTIRTFRKGDLTTQISEIDPSSVKAADLVLKAGRKYTDNGISNNILVINIPKEIADKHGLNSSSSPS